jgi:hypothetical protein
LAEQHGRPAALRHAQHQPQRRRPGRQRARPAHGCGQLFSVQPDLKLPAGAHSFNINYSAASLRQPEGVHFQYRMEGADRDWQDASPRRTAYYTNVPPGAYRFQVRAANEE